MSSRASPSCRAPPAVSAGMAPAGVLVLAPPVGKTRMARASQGDASESGQRSSECILDPEPVGPFLPPELPSGSKWCALLALAGSDDDDHGDSDDYDDDYDDDYVLDDFVVADEEADKLSLHDYQRKFVESARWLICSKMKQERDYHRISVAKFKQKSASRANANTKRRRASRLKHKFELKKIDDWSKSILAQKMKNLRGGKKRRGGKKNKREKTNA